MNIFTRLILIAILFPISACATMQPKTPCPEAFQARLECIKANMKSDPSIGNSPQGVRFLAVGEEIAERLRAGVITETKARAELAVEFERDASSAAANAPVICNHVGTSTICN
jgi:hypothetical protein